MKKKLFLTKNTISKLDSKDMGQLKGGLASIKPTSDSKKQPTDFTVKFNWVREGMC